MGGTVNERKKLKPELQAAFPDGCCVLIPGSPGAEPTSKSNVTMADSSLTMLGLLPKQHQELNRGASAVNEMQSCARKVLNFWRGLQ